MDCDTLWHVTQGWLMAARCRVTVMASRPAPGPGHRSFITSLRVLGPANNMDRPLTRDCRLEDEKTYHFLVSIAPQWKGQCFMTSRKYWYNCIFLWLFSAGLLITALMSYCGENEITIKMNMRLKQTLHLKLIWLRINFFYVFKTGHLSCFQSKLFATAEV